VNPRRFHGKFFVVFLKNTLDNEGEVAAVRKILELIESHLNYGW